MNSVVHQTENTQKVEISEETDILRISSQNRISRKLTTDFESRTKRQAKTKACVFMDVDHKAIPYRASLFHFATGKFHPFRTLPV